VIDYGLEKTRLPPWHIDTRHVLAAIDDDLFAWKDPACRSHSSESTGPGFPACKRETGLQIDLRQQDPRPFDKWSSIYQINLAVGQGELRRVARAS
jgi:hypothetical protein